VCATAPGAASLAAQAPHIPSHAPRAVEKPDVGDVHEVSVVSPIIISFRAPRHAAIHPTAAQALAHVGYVAARAYADATSAINAHYPKDSLRVVMEREAQAWIDRLPRPSAEGADADAYVTLASIAHRDSVARQMIAARLATPALSLQARAYTLYTGIGQFGSADYPDRLPIAEEYLRQLDALGADAAYWQVEARKALIVPYYRLGRSSDVIRVGTQAFARVRQLPFELRAQVVYTPGIAFQYASVVDALGGQPDGRSGIRMMNAELAAAAVPPAAYVARDSAFVYVGQDNLELLRSQTAMAERVGAPATPIVANYWINRGATRDSQTVAVADGKIHVLEIGSWTCVPCVSAIPALERLHHRYPEVDFNFLTWGDGKWGNRVVSPDTEAVRLAEHFVKKLGATFPIGIALSTRLAPTEDGGQESVRSTSTWDPDHYPQSSKPTFYVVDGHGVIRHVIGGFTRAVEDNLASVIAFLQQETPGEMQQRIIPSVTSGSR